MAASKRNAGLTSTVPRGTLNNEELVSMCVTFSADTYFSLQKNKY